MNRYRITNKETGEVREVEAEFLGNAISALGWDIDNVQSEILEASWVKKRGRPKKTTPVEQPTEETKSEPPLSPDVIEEARAIAKSDQADAEAVAKFEKKLEKDIEQLDIHKLSSDATDAEKTAYAHKQTIENLAVEAEVMFLRMGQLLYEAREKAEWSILHYESYREYVESLALPMTNSYSWATRLASIYEYLVKNMGLDEKLLAEIGVAKLTRLLPLARKGELTEEIIEAARVLSDLDLRESLGHSVGSGETEEWITCPRCGESFDAKKAVHQK